MRILCTGDWHAHNFTDFSHTLSVKWSQKLLRYTEVENDESLEVREMNSRLFFILKGICDMRDYCLENNIPAVLFSGDMFHHRGTIDVTVFNAVYKVLGSFYQTGITVHAIAGNHDQTDNSQVPISALHAFKEVIHVIEKPEYFVIGDSVEVVAVPYSKDKEFVLDSIKSLRDKCSDPWQSILLCHLGVDGGLVGSGMHMMSDEYSLRDLMYDKFKYVVCGHYHQPQILEYNSIYCGTPVQNNFGDEIKGKDGYNGFFVIDTNRRWDIHFVPIIAPRFVTVSSVEELEQLDADFIKNNYIRVKSKSKQASQIQDKLEDMLDGDTQSIRLELEKDYDTESRSEVGVTQSPQETVMTYATEKWEDQSTLEYATSKGLEILNTALNGGK